MFYREGTSPETTPLLYVSEIEMIGNPSLNHL
jgi:hypothetical protein